MVHQFASEEERLDEIRRLIAVFEQQIEDDFTFNNPARHRLTKYKRWLRELESEAQ